MSRQNPEEIKNISTWRRSQKRAQEKEANKPSHKNTTKQQSGKQFTDTLVKMVLMKLISENNADELNNTGKEQICFSCNEAIAFVVSQGKSVFQKVNGSLYIDTVLV